MRSLCILSIAFATGCTSSAPDKPTERVNATAHAAIGAPTVAEKPTPVELGWVSIPEGFVPADPETVVNSLRGKRPTDSAATVFEIPATGGDEFTYDTAQKKLVIALPIYSCGRWHNSTRSRPNCFGLLVKSTSKTVATYSGENVFGIPGDILRDERRDIGFNIVDEDLPDRYLETSMDRDTAKVLMPRLRLLFVVKPQQWTPGQIVTDSLSYHTPTFFDRAFATTHIANLWVKSLGVWLYDSQTRKILFKKEIERVHYAE